MGVEIERKFKVNDSFRPTTVGIEMAQGYLSRDPKRTVRIRTTGIQGFLTIKGETHGASRCEYEYEIPLTEALELLELCGRRRLTKTRYIVPYKGKNWEVDVFSGRHEGLMIAELEVASADELVELPEWVGQEVTGDPRYYNSRLAAEQ